MHQELKQVGRYGFGLTALTAFFLLVVFLLLPYSKLEIAFQEFNSERTQFYPWNDFTGTYGFSEITYWLALGGFFFITLISTVFLFKLKPEERSGISFLSFLSQRIKAVWQKMPLLEKWLAGITWVLLAGVSYYVLYNSRINIDEAVTEVFFLRKGLPGLLFYYALPNNHILYNLFCLPLQYAFEDPFWVLKLPAFVLSLSGTAVIYLAYRSAFPFPVAFFTTVLFSFSQYALYFATHGRGYSLLSIWAALAAVAILKICEQKHAYYWLFFMVCSVIGFYAIPPFLYPFLAICFFALVIFSYRRNWQALKQFLVSGFFVAVITLLLYSPAILGSGLKLLFSNKYVAGKSPETYYQQFPFLFTYTQGSVIGQETVGFYVWLFGFTGLSFILLFRKRLANLLQATHLKPVVLLLVWCNMILPWVFIFLQRVRPPERVLYYKGFFDLLALTIVCYLICFYLLRKLNFQRAGKFLVTGFLILSALFGMYQVGKVSRNENMEIADEGFEARLQTIYQSGAHTIYSNEIYYSTNLKHEFYKNNPEGLVLHEYDFDPEIRYEVIILDKAIAAPTTLSLRDFRLFHEDRYVKIYYHKTFDPSQLARKPIPADNKPK